jgi:hypothetical protein
MIVRVRVRSQNTNKIQIYPIEKSLCLIHYLMSDVTPKFVKIAETSEKSLSKKNFFQHLSAPEYPDDNRGRGDKSCYPICSDTFAIFWLWPRNTYLNPRPYHRSHPTLLSAGRKIPMTHDLA